MIIALLVLLVAGCVLGKLGLVIASAVLSLLCISGIVAHACKVRNITDDETRAVTMYVIIIAAAVVAMTVV